MDRRPRPRRGQNYPRVRRDERAPVGRARQCEAPVIIVARSFTLVPSLRSSSRAPTPTSSRRRRPGLASARARARVRASRSFRGRDGRQPSSASAEKNDGGRGGSSRGAESRRTSQRAHGAPQRDITPPSRPVTSRGPPDSMPHPEASIHNLPSSNATLSVC